MSASGVTSKLNTHRLSRKPSPRGAEERNLYGGVQPEHVVMSAAAQARAADAQGLDQPATDYHTVPGRS